MYLAARFWSVPFSGLIVSRQVVPQGERLQEEYGEINGLDALKANVKQAQSSLTPDDQFFDDDKLVSLRDEAIEAHRSGLTEPLLENERIH